MNLEGFAIERNAFFDNAKVILIFFVVLGHMIQPFAGDSTTINAIYTWIYIFHMPAFIFLAGFFAKGIGEPKYIWKLFKKLIIPYLLFQIVYTGYYFAIGKPDWDSSILDPQWSLWFLVSLFSWHMLLIVFKKVPMFWSIALSVLVGVIAGYFGQIGETLSLSRTLVFFPFFLTGYFLTVKQVMFVKSNYVKVGAAVAMTALFVLLYTMPDIDTGWLLASQSYSELGANTEGSAIRFTVYIAASIMTISIFAFVPTQRISWVTDLGSRTLYVYLLHGFIIQFLRQFDILSVNHWYDFLFLIIISLLIVLVLSSKFILSITQPLVELKANRMRTLIK
jgi:fucose 4-O-acetylase-like acetyltransferase